MKIERLGGFLVLTGLAASLPACGGGGGAPSGVGVQQSTASRDLTPSVPTSDATELAADNQAFAVDLYQQLRTGSGNLVFSPASISIAMAMLYNGAANGTATEMASALHFTLPVDRLNAAFDAMDLALTAPPADAGSFALDVASSTFTQQGFPILPAYLDVLATDYGSAVDTVDFEKAPDTARASINQWVADQTHDLIPTLFPAGTIDASTRLVLADAVYFHGDWTSPFEANSPTGTFHALSGDVSVPMMSGGSAEVWTGTGWSAASLGYQGETTSMVLVVPDAGTFDSFEQGLTTDALASILTGASGNIGGSIEMPRFDFSAAESLNGVLSALGMPDAFMPGAADFSGIDGATDLNVETVVHQANIAVDETGTTAAAATGVGVGELGVETPALVVDRPFLFFIVHQPTGALLFAGRVVDPSQGS